MGAMILSDVTTERGRMLRGVALAFAGAACWGFSGTCVSWLTGHGVSVPWLANMRLAIAGVLFLAVALVRDRDKLVHLARDRSLVFQLVVYALVGVVLLQISYMSAIAYTNAGTALLLQEVCIPLVLVYACIRGRRAPKAGELAAIVLAAVGVVAIATQGQLGALGINPMGLAWGMVCAFAMAGYNVIPVRLIRECGSFATNGVAMVLSAAAMAPFVRPWEARVSLDAGGWLVFAAVVLVGTMLAYVVYLRGVALAGPVKASLIGVFEPLSGAFFSAVWLGTAFSGWDFLGGAAIIAMMLLVARLR